MIHKPDAQAKECAYSFDRQVVLVLVLVLLILFLILILLLILLLFAA